MDQTTADLLPPAAPEPMKFYLTGRVLVLDGVHYRPRVEYTGFYGHGPGASITFDLTLWALDPLTPEVEGELVLSMPWGVGVGPRRTRLCSTSPGHGARPGAGA